MDIQEQIEIVKILKADLIELNGGYQTNVVLAEKKADSLINHLEKVNNSGVLDNVVHSVLVEVAEKIVEKLKHCYEQRDNNMDDQMWSELTGCWLDYLEEKIPNK